MPPDAPHLADEDLSDVVDGQGTPDGLAHLDQCDQCSARLETWRRVSAAVGALALDTVPPPEAKSRAVQAALAASKAAPQYGPRPARGVSRLASPRGVAWASGLAAAVLAVVGISVAVSHGGSNSVKSSSSGAAAPINRGETAGSATTVASSGHTAAGGPASSASAPAGRDLGRVAGPAALQSAVNDQYRVQTFSASSTTTAATPAAASSTNKALANTQCPAPAGGVPQVVDTAVYAGTPAEVYVYSAQAGERVIVVQATATCTVLLNRSFPSS